MADSFVTHTVDYVHTLTHSLTVYDSFFFLFYLLYIWKQRHLISVQLNTSILTAPQQQPRHRHATPTSDSENVNLIHENNVCRVPFRRRRRHGLVAGLQTPTQWLYSKGKYS